MSSAQLFGSGISSYYDLLEIKVEKSHIDHVCIRHIDHVCIRSHQLLEKGGYQNGREPDL